MIKILTDDIEALKDACEFLAYELARHKYPNQYEIRDEQVQDILICEGLQVVIEDEEM